MDNNSSLFSKNVLKYAFAQYILSGNNFEGSYISIFFFLFFLRHTLISKRIALGEWRISLFLSTTSTSGGHDFASTIIPILQVKRQTSEKSPQYHQYFQLKRCRCHRPSGKVTREEKSRIPCISVGEWIYMGQSIKKLENFFRVK